MKLTSFRLKDRVHLLEVGLVDETWLEKVPPELSGRLLELIEKPEA